MCNSNDIPVTRAEERELYGEEVSEFEHMEAHSRHLKAIDAYDVLTLCDEFSEEICKAFHAGEPVAIGAIVSAGLKAMANARANIELYGTSKQREPIPQMRGTLADLGKLTIKVKA